MSLAKRQGAVRWRVSFSSEGMINLLTEQIDGQVDETEKKSRTEKAKVIENQKAEGL